MTALSRGIATARWRQPEASWLSIDINRQTSPEHWLSHLQGIEAVVNCAGALQDGPSDSLKGVHTVGISALFAACERLRIRRVVHFSAIGVDRATPTASLQCISASARDPYCLTGRQAASGTRAGRLFA